jgi:bifunctional non-homologous end joining protein LigD
MVKRVRRAGVIAEQSEMPGFIKPQLATLKTRAPSGDQWLHEIKFDGYRVQVHLNKGKRKVYTRNGLDWTKRFSLIAGALDIPGQAVIDGEVVVVHEGRTNFSELQAELAAGHQDRLVYYAFTFFGVMATSASSRRLSGSKCFLIFSAKTASNCRSFIPNT